MTMYCVDFESGSSWVSNPGSFEQHYVGAPACARDWIIMQTTDFDGLVAASSGDPPATTAFTEAEVASLKYQAANPSPFNLSISDGSLVSGAIAGTWALAWVLKQLVRALNTDGEKETS